MNKKIVIFDIGNVILDYNPMQFLRRKYPRADSAHAIKSLYNNIFAGEEWQMLDRGVITYDDAIAAFTGRIPQYAEQIAEVMDIWWKYLTVIKPTLKVMYSLAGQGVPMYYLSNFHEDASIKLRGLFDFWDMFKGGVFSWEEKILKPEPEIYIRLLDKYKLKAEDCVFTDDIRENIDAANALGFHGILFESGEKLKASLEEILNVTL